MGISLVKSAFKVADVVLDESHKVRKIKFSFLDKIKNKDGGLLDKAILKDDSGRIYFLVSNKKIMKIGKSKCKGGIKQTMGSYQGGMQGGPSIRTFGIHILLKEELYKGKKVEVYMMLCKKAKMFVEGLFGEEKIYITPPDVLMLPVIYSRLYKEVLQEKRPMKWAPSILAN